MRPAWSMRPELCALLLPSGPRCCAPRGPVLVSCARELPWATVLRRGVLSPLYGYPVACPVMTWACEVPT